MTYSSESEEETPEENTQVRRKNKFVSAWEGTELSAAISLLKEKGFGFDYRTKENKSSNRKVIKIIWIS